MPAIWASLSPFTILPGCSVGMMPGMSTSTDSAAREHLRQASSHLHEAARAWTDQFIDPKVRTHLRQAARSVLEAGLAAVDAAERRDHSHAAPAATPTAAPAQP